MLRTDSLLEMFCSVRNIKPAVTGSLDLSPRAKFICNFLEFIYNVDYAVDVFSDKSDKKPSNASILKEVADLFFHLNEEEIGGSINLEEGRLEASFDLDDLYDKGLILAKEPSYYNIVLKFPCEEDTEDSVILTAHHDVANVNSDNCQDNSASVVNLLDIARKVKEQDLRFNKNVYIVFLDGEEVSKKGARHHSEEIKKGHYGNVKCVLNSELTATGNNIWVEESSCCKKDGDLHKLISEVYGQNMAVKFCPSNDSVEYRQNDINSVCFGLLPDSEIDSRAPKTWSVCHSPKDSYSCNVENMRMYQDFLIKLIDKL